MLEAIAAILTLGSVILLKYKKRSGWWIGIIAAILYGIVFWQSDIFFQSALQIIFVIQCIDGLYSWNSLIDLKIKQKDFFEIFDPIAFFTTLCIIGFLTGLTLTNLEELSIGYIDVYTFGLALFANWLLIKGIIQSWYVWILLDVILIGLFYYLELWWSVGLYVILLSNAIHASLKWNKEYKLKILK